MNKISINQVVDAVYIPINEIKSVFYKNANLEYILFT